MRLATLLLLIILPLMGSLHVAENFTDANPEQQLISKIFSAKKRPGSKLPARNILEMASTGYYNLKAIDMLTKASVLTIIDYGLPFDTERMWVVDVNSGKVLYNCLVAHARNSGDLFATNFSNTNGSFTSSEGFYLTGDTYYGRHGLSLYLEGLEEGINSNARERYIVIHSAEYVTYDFIRNHGRLGRSHGCPAVPPGKHKEIIKTIKGGSCLFIYAPLEDYPSKSTVLNSRNENQL